MMDRHKAIYFSRLGPELFCLLLDPTGFNCWFSSVPVFQWCCSTSQGSPDVGRNMLFLSSSSLLHYSIYPWFICFPWWSIDELENIHADRTTDYMFWAIIEAEREAGLPSNRFKSPSILILTVPRRNFCCCSLLLLVLAVRIFTFVHLLCEWHIQVVE